MSYNHLLYAIRIGAFGEALDALNSGLKFKEDEFMDRSMLHIAVSRGSPTKLIDELIKRFPNQVHSTDEFGDTPLHYACQARDFFNKGAKFDWEKFNRIEIVSILLSHGADPKIKGYKGKTPLDFSKECNAPQEIIDLLVKDFV